MSIIDGWSPHGVVRFQAMRRAELRRWREGDKRAAPPAIGIKPPTIEEMRKGRPLSEVWNVPRYLLPYSGK